MNKSFRNKIIVLIVGVVWLTQLATFISVISTTDRNVRREVNNGLISATKIYERLVDNRNSQLLNAVEILSADFGLKEVIATGDAATIRSAILNHGRRINAGIIRVLSLDGKEITSTEGVIADKTEIDYEALIATAEESGFLLDTVVSRDVLYQSVLVPVLAPTPIAWILIGFSIDDMEADGLKQLIGADITFVLEKNNKRMIAATTLPVALRQEMLEKSDNFNMPQYHIATININEDDYLTSIHTLSATNKDVQVLLQHSVNDAMKPYKALKNEILYISIVFSIIAIALAVYMAGSITRPVKKLVTAASRIEEGDYETTIDIKSNDEFGKLADTFNQMQAGIAQREQRLIRHAHYDELTGLANRLLITDRIDNAIERAKRGNNEFSLLLFSISQFKDINASFGHVVGDTVLNEVARRISSRIRASDAAARIGGDEFLVLLEGAQSDVAIKIAESMLITVKNTIDLGTAKINLNLHAGIVNYPEHGHNALELIRRVDVAMNKSRDNFSEIAQYEPGTDEGHLRQLSIVSGLKKAAEEDQFVLNFQPKVDAYTGEVLELESLIRWTNPDYGYMPPDEFIPIAEQSGNIPLLTDWVLKNALHQCKLWREQHNLSINISVNLSAVDLLNPELPDLISHYLQLNGVNPSQLILEITESAVVRDTNFALQLLNKIKVAGVSLSIDDYGTGFSSLAKLKQLPVSELKIDKSFVMNLTEDGDDAAIVLSTIELGHNMGLKVTAEGVENAKGQKLLKQYGCDMLQGYYICKPLLANEFPNWLKTYNQGLTSKLKKAKDIIS